MDTSKQAQATAFKDCLQEALVQCPLLIERCYSELVDALYARAVASPGSTDKRRLQDVLAALRQNQSAIRQGFEQQLTHAIKADTGTDAAGLGKPGRSLSQLDFDDLELMGDEQVQQTVDSARLLQIVSAACEAGLAGFSARLSTAQGFGVVKAHRNPLRPEIFCQALLMSRQAVAASDDAWSAWLLYGAQPLGNQLQALYAALDRQLAAQGIAPAAYAVMSSPGDRPANAPLPVSTVQAADRAKEPSIAGATVHSDGGAVLTLDHLHRLLAGDYDASFKEELLPGGFERAAHGFSHTVPAAMDGLAQLKEKEIAALHAKKAGIAPPQSLAQMRVQLKTEAKSLGQSLAIEVIGLMIGQMACDSRLLAPVRQVIADAEPAFLRLGITDPRFFSDRKHPGRMLLETITTGSLAYASEDAPGFAQFMADLNDTAQWLGEEHAGDARHFETVLKSFEAKLALGSSGSSPAQSRAVQALLQAEQRNLLAEKITEEICARPDFAAHNRIVTVFLTGPWAQVMAGERLLNEQGAAGSRKAEFSLTLGELLWSLDPAQTSGHQKRLAKIGPRMLESLRSGLVSIDYPLAQSKGFFDELMKIHQAALSAKPAAADPKIKSRQILNAVFDAGAKMHAGRPWLAPSEARNSGFMDDSDIHTKPGFAATRPHAREGIHAPQAGLRNSVTVKMARGDWVEILSDDQWLRVQLTWISPFNTLYMFTSAEGRTHSMSGSLLQYLLLQEQVKVVSQQGVVQGALNMVALTAMRNSVDEDRAG